MNRNPVDQNSAHTRIGASAAAVIMDESGCALIVKPTYKPKWNLPGGRVEDGELPRVACAREILEEVGLEVTVGDLLVHAWVHVKGSGSHTYYLFDTPALSDEQRGAIKLQASELDEARFVAPADIDPEIIPPHAHAMWKAALVARAEGRAQYVEVEM